jgi:hypothetical protein
MIASPVSAQGIISAKVGIIQYIEGVAYLDDKLLQPNHFQFDNYIQMKDGQILQTKQGRAELLLTPDSYLRMGEDGLLRLEQNALKNIQLALERGSVLIEVVRDMKGNPMKLHYSKSVIEIRKAGLYRLDADSGVFRVYGGKAQATNENGKITVTVGRMVPLDGKLVSSKFSVDSTDVLHKWAAQRSFNLVSANRVGFGRWMLTAAGWLHNPDFRATLYSPAFYNVWLQRLNQAKNEEELQKARQKAAEDKVAADKAAAEWERLDQAGLTAHAQAAKAEAEAAASQPSK